MPPDRGSTWSSARSVSWAKSSSSSARRGALGPGQAEVAAVDEQVLADASARCRACPAGARRRAGRGSAGRRVAGSRPRIDSVPPLSGETQPIIRIVEVLPAPLGPRKPNDSPGATSKSMPSTAVNVAEALGQAAGMDERGGGGRRGAGSGRLRRHERVGHGTGMVPRRRAPSGPWSETSRNLLHRGSDMC